MSDNNAHKESRCARHPDPNWGMRAYDELPKEIREALGNFSMNYCPSCIKEVIDRGAPIGGLLVDLCKLDARYIVRYRAEYENGLR